MLVELVEKLEEMSKVEEFQFDNREYTSKQLHPVKGPTPTSVHVNTLDGFIDLVKLWTTPFIDTEIPENSEPWGVYYRSDTFFIQVKDFDEVCLKGIETDEWEQRAELACVNLKNYPFGFRFGEKYEAESFNIALQSMFVDDYKRAQLLSLIGNMTAEGSVSVADDGVTQAVSQRAGVVLKTKEVVPNPIELAPIRTFREIEQVKVPCVFRVHQDREGSLPKCALYEADGGAWKITAIKRVADYLREKLPGFNIIA